MTLLSQLRKAATRSPDELRVRGTQAAYALLERTGLLDSGVQDDAGFLRRLLPPLRGASADQLLAHFRTRTAPAFFDGVRSHTSAEALNGPAWAAARAALIRDAEGVLTEHFDLLGYPALDYGTPIDWQCDPVSGKRAPLIHWSRIPYLDAAQVGDHKVIWEINRHQHFFVLGRAWQVAGDPRYAERFVAHVNAWMDANPPKLGINWASSLEVSFRAISWLWALELFRDAPQLTAPLLLRMLKYLEIHAHHLERYLSTYFSPNTHLTGEALGLLYLGTLLPELPDAKRWRATGWRILEAWLPRHIQPDGVYFEQASYYHRYTADIYLHAILLAERNGRPVPESVRARLALGIDHLAAITRPGGTIPIIGDDDGGQLVSLESREFTDVRATLATAAVVLGRPEYAAVAGAVTEEALWLLGPEGAKKAAAGVEGEPPRRASQLFPVGGYAVMRDGWGAGALHAVIDCGPLGNSNAGHAHSDALSVDLAIGGCPVLVDPGTYSYTGSWEARQHFRHSAAHNTVTINGASASTPAGPFSWQDRADAQAEQWWAGRLVDRLVGSHPGFERLGIGASHRREFWLVRGSYWLIVDHVGSQAATEAVAHFHTAIGVELESMEASSAMLRIPCRGGWRQLLFSTAGDVQPIAWEEDWVSHSYGSRDRAAYARLVSAGSGDRQLISVLCPQDEEENVSIHEQRLEKGRMLLVNRQNMYDQVLLSSDGLVQSREVVLRGESALVRRSARDGALSGIALFGTDARLEVDDVVMTANGAAEAVRTAEGWQVSGDGHIAPKP